MRLVGPEATTIPCPIPGCFPGAELPARGSRRPGQLRQRLRAPPARHGRRRAAHVRLQRLVSRVPTERPAGCRCGMDAIGVRRKHPPGSATVVYPCTLGGPWRGTRRLSALAQPMRARGGEGLQTWDVCLDCCRRGLCGRVKGLRRGLCTWPFARACLRQRDGGGQGGLRSTSVRPFKALDTPCVIRRKKLLDSTYVCSSSCPSFASQRAAGARRLEQWLQPAKAGGAPLQTPSCPGEDGSSLR